MAAGTSGIPTSPIPAAAARLSIAAATTFIALLAVSHLAKPELDPSWRVISEYAIGSHGWVMALAFFSLAVACAALVVAIRSDVNTITGYVGLAFLLASAAGLVLAAVFTTDPITAGAAEATTSGSLHTVGASLGTGIPLAAVLLGATLARTRTWSSARRALIGAAAFAWLGFLVFSGSMVVMLPQNDGALGPEVLIGWPNRFLMLAYSAWLVTVATLALQRRRTSSREGRSYATS